MTLFSATIDGFADVFRQRATTAVKKVALELHNRIVIKTPVDTGRARGNWLVAVGQIPSSVTELLDTNKGNRPNQQNTAAALRALASYDALDELAIYVVNNLDYIRFLEDGSSKQAPSGMVAITVAEFQDIVKKASR